MSACGSPDEWRNVPLGWELFLTHTHTHTLTHSHTIKALNQKKPSGFNGGEGAELVPSEGRITQT